MTTKVFYSWQSDLRAAACRSLIQDALEGAASAIAEDNSVAVEPVVDRDTQNVPGSPDIGATILAKIDAASVFVADVTLVGKTDGGKPTPNPNVLIELGYALKALDWSRIILVQNTAFGGPEQLPFDLRQKRTLTYSSPTEASERATQRTALRRTLEDALREVLRQPRLGHSDVELRLDYEKVNIRPTCHDYRLVAAIRNTGRRRLADWYIEVEFPTPLLDDTVYGAKVASRSDAQRSLFRAGSDTFKQPLRVGDSREIRLSYRITDALYAKRDEVFGELVKCRAFVDGDLVDEVEKPVEDLQNF